MINARGPKANAPSWSNGRDALRKYRASSGICPWMQGSACAATLLERRATSRQNLNSAFALRHCFVDQQLGRRRLVTGAMMRLGGAQNGDRRALQPAKGYVIVQACDSVVVFRIRMTLLPSLSHPDASATAFGFAPTGIVALTTRRGWRTIRQDPPDALRGMRIATQDMHGISISDCAAPNPYHPSLSGRLQAQLDAATRLDAPGLDAPHSTPLADNGRSQWDWTATS